MKCKCELCEYQTVIGNFCGNKSEYTLNIKLCQKHWDKCYYIYYLKGIPDHIPIEQHRKWLIAKLSKKYIY